MKKKKNGDLIDAVIGLALFPAAVIFQMAKDMNKPKRRKTGGRGHRKKDYWPHK